MYKNLFIGSIGVIIALTTYMINNQKFNRWEFCHFGDYRLFEVDHLGYFCVERKSTDLIKRSIKNNILWEVHVLEALKSIVKKDDIVLDVGAYIGTHTIFTSKLLGPKGKVHAFEPVEKTYKELMINIQANELENVTLHKIALGSENKMIEMNPIMSSNAGGTQIGKGGDKAQLKTLDSFDFKKIDLIKIDVEEFEDDLIKGAKKTIEKHHPTLIIEVQGSHDHNKASEETKKKIEYTHSSLRKLGYKIFRIWGADYLAIPEKDLKTLDQKTLSFIEKIQKYHNKKS